MAMIKLKKHPYLILFFSCTLLSCTDFEKNLKLNPKEEFVISKPISSKNGKVNGVSAINYTTSPKVNIWTNTSSGTLNLSCAAFASGLRSKVTAINGNKITIQIQRGDGKIFGNSGTAYIKAMDLCGNVAANVTFPSNYNYVNLDITATFTSGTVFFYPSITMGTSRMHSNPITVTAINTVSTGYFGSPISSQAYSYCKFGSLECFEKGSHHTGIDYPGTTSTSIVSIGDGKVVAVEKMSANDHGMGNNVIVQHTLENGNKVYSTYSHMSSINVSLNQIISIGAKIGNVGGSGKGISNKWGNHLHLELKSCAQSGTCWNGTFWGYTPNHPTVYGYLDPLIYIGKLKYIKN